MINILLVAPIIIPLIAGVAIYFLKSVNARRRGIFTLIVSIVNAVITWLVILSPELGEITVLHFTARLGFSFSVDGMGRIFAALSSTLWPFTALYALDYMKDEERTGMLYAFFLISFGVTEGIAFSSNILTMYLFYEFLTLSTIPLVIHGMKKRDVYAAKKYMIYSFGGAALAFTGVAYLIYCDKYSFIFGGHFSGADGENNLALAIFIISFVGFGIKAAIFPFSSWLPTASVAPTPVTALLHSVAVVKAGAFAVIRLIYFSYGIEFLQGTYAQSVTNVLCAVTILYGSAMALKETHFKRRLAYSTVANLSYILFAASLMSKSGLLAASLHMVNHSVIKIGAFFVAGAVMKYAKKEYIYQLDGIGKRMPVSFCALAVGAISLAGLPPLNGFISKWYIGSAAIDGGTATGYIGITALLISALLTSVYMFTPLIRAFFYKSGEGEAGEASTEMLVPIILSAVLCVVFGIFGGSFANMLAEVLTL